MTKPERTTVLIVDDEPLLVETIAYNLERAGYAALKAGDGATALEQVRAGRPQLVILDVMLPGLSGWEVCHALRTDATYRFTGSILILSARSEDASKSRALSLGADAYLVKPFAMTELLSLVRKLLRDE